VTAPFTNRLAREKSPYLLQHAHNPVDWHAWNDEAFRLAQQENKPIFLSVGYSTCHWCHVMERESFENEAIGKFLSEHFISIKVDREERPDVDKIYLTFVQSTTGSGGWPMSVFLTPDRQPFFGGTYFPPAPSHGRPSFLQMLQQIARLWHERKADLIASAAELHARLESLTLRTAETDSPLTAETVARAVEIFQGVYDPQHGGFGGAPKFPQPSIPLLVLRQTVKSHDQAGQKMVWHTCERMAAGGIHDQLGGGFARYAVDAEWLVPHFEKMLYDNAQLTQLYLDAYLTSHSPAHADTVRDILAYVLRDLTHPQGGFYSAEDADSEGHEGKFYCWTKAELARLLPPEEFNVVAQYYGISVQGNFVDHSHPHPLPGQNVLSIVQPNLPAPDQPLLASARQKMLAARNQRIRPHLDDKILTSWNGLMLGAFARASVILGEKQYTTAAINNFNFIRQNLWSAPSAPHTTGTLYHRWRDGARDQVELLETYAFYLEGVIHLYEATLQPAYLEFAVPLAEAMLEKFYDRENGGFWQSPLSATDLILRLKDDYDGAEPSGNSVATLALLKLAAHTGQEKFQTAATHTLQLVAHRLQTQPGAQAYLLQALDFWLTTPQRIVITGDPATPACQELLRTAHQVYQPNKIVSGVTGPVTDFAQTLKTTSTPTAYVCTGTACQPPVTDPVKLKELLCAKH
jgi:hypothetical protein